MMADMRRRSLSGRLGSHPGSVSLHPNPDVSMSDHAASTAPTSDMHASAAAATAATSRPVGGPACDDGLGDALKNRSSKS